MDSSRNDRSRRLATFAGATDGLYRCSDGTFTNQVERQCPPYEPMGIVPVQGGAGETAKPPFAELTLFALMETTRHTEKRVIQP
jgi:hypothetical protein